MSEAMDLNCNAYRLRWTQLDVPFVGVDCEYARANFQMTCGFADLLDQFCTKISLPGADRIEVHDQPSAHPYRQKGRDCLMTSI
ncbi:MAG: hypothetical protein JWP25_4291 [Bradyrhizobium sp.]|jgi:hypothetical protein|nr:hypothetical protein [Bradyrhizobium sp.]